MTMDLLIPDKVHDESRQGEALILEPVGKTNGRKLYIESYGCAMNFSDSEIVASILAERVLKPPQILTTPMLFSSTPARYVKMPKYACVTG
jgi:hypothetical protein